MVISNISVYPPVCLSAHLSASVSLHSPNIKDNIQKIDPTALLVFI